MINIGQQLNTAFDSIRNAVSVLQKDTAKTDFMIQHPVKGIVPFILEDYQQRLVKKLQSKYVLINHGRQMGITTTLCMDTILRALNKPNHKIFWLSPSYNNGINLCNIMIFMLHNSKYREDVSEYRKSKLVFKNGSEIIFRAVANETLRGLQQPNRIIIDSAAYVSHNTFYNFWVNIQHYQSEIIISSNPYEGEGLFYDLWTQGGIKWKKIMLPWYEMSSRDDDWFEEQKRYLGENVIYEHCCEFKPKI